LWRLRELINFARSLLIQLFNCVELIIASFTQKVNCLEHEQH
jgi:hypothetical protein